MNIPALHHPATRLFFFLTGLLATVAYRVIIFVTDGDPVVLRVVWYIGTVGFIVYFLHRYQVAVRRARVIEGLGLANKISGRQQLSEQDLQGLRYVFATLQSSKERWNYYVIFASSAIALIAGLWVDLFGHG